MSKLGSWSTFDAPTDKQDEAFEWLKVKVREIGGNVRRVMNDHDLGGYPSFEIDRPVEFDDLDEDDDLEDEELVSEYRIWVEAINKVEEEYNSKYEEYL